MTDTTGDIPLATASVTDATNEKPSEAADTKAELTSDAEVIDLDAPAPDEGAEKKEPEAKTEQKTEAKDEAKDEDDKSDDDADEGDQPPKRLKGAAKWRERFREAQARIAELEASKAPEIGADGRETARSEPSSDIEAEVIKRIGPRPVESDFKDWTEFSDAKIAWQIEATAERRDIRRERAQVETRQREDLREIMSAHEARLEEFEKHVPDIQDVLSKSSLEIRTDLARFIVESEKSAHILNHFARNPDKVKAFNNLSQRDALKEIGRLEDRLHLPKPKTETKATPPGAQLKGGAAPHSDEAELQAWLKKTYG